MFKRILFSVTSAISGFVGAGLTSLVPGFTYDMLGNILVGAFIGVTAFFTWARRDS